MCRAIFSRIQINRTYNYPKNDIQTKPPCFNECNGFIRAPKILFQYDTGQNLLCGQRTLSVTSFYFCRRNRKRTRRSDLGLHASSLKTSEDCIFR